MTVVNSQSRTHSSSQSSFQSKAHSSSTNRFFKLTALLAPILLSGCGSEDVVIVVDFNPNDPPAQECREIPSDYSYTEVSTSSTYTTEISYSVLRTWDENALMLNTEITKFTSEYDVFRDIQRFYFELDDVVEEFQTFGLSMFDYEVLDAGYNVGTWNTFDTNGKLISTRTGVGTESRTTIDYDWSSHDSSERPLSGTFSSIGSDLGYVWGCSKVDVEADYDSNNLVKSYLYRGSENTECKRGYIGDEVGYEFEEFNERMTYDQYHNLIKYEKWSGTEPVGEPSFSTEYTYSYQSFIEVCI